MTELPLVPVKFTFDGQSPEFEGYTDGSTWNGFLNVRVTPRERRRIASWMRSEAGDEQELLENVQDLLDAPAETETVLDGGRPVKKTLVDMSGGYATARVRGT